MSQAVFEGHKTYRNRGVGVAAIVVVGLSALSIVIVTVLCWVIKISIDRGGSAANLDTASTLERVAGVAAIPYSIFQLAALVLTIVWLWRARKNLDAFPDAKPSLGAGWTIGGWFLPIANLIVPGRIMANAARESTQNRWVTRVAVIWWIALLVTWAADRVGNLWAENALYTSDILDLEMLSDYYGELARANTVAAAAGVIAAAAFAFTVSRVSAAQEERIHRGWYEEQNRALAAAAPALREGDEPSNSPAASGVGQVAESVGSERWDPTASSEAGQAAEPVGAERSDPAAASPAGQAAEPVGADQRDPAAASAGVQVAEPVGAVRRDPSAPSGAGQAAEPVGAERSDPTASAEPGQAAEPGGAERSDATASSEAGQAAEPVGTGADSGGLGVGPDQVGVGGDPASSATVGGGSAQPIEAAVDQPSAGAVTGVTPRAAAPGADGSATIGA
ncbi:protein of unknown function [Asanoa hainanensis]|uniref:DUF4328 domain-containing protein n=1 Tax=Asanoa hainanensis TaxID=560556 RepID=A0A239IA82_9ACTN|nr:DUF4328 domain-containing protein [Asanoa hainanensis]SNS90530.1 protein of unknown function [Asanoa hainanensis]